MTTDPSREAFEKWYAKYHDNACDNYGGIDCTNPKGIAEDAWQAAMAHKDAELQQAADVLGGGAGLREEPGSVEGVQADRFGHGRKAPRLIGSIAALSPESGISRREWQAAASPPVA